MGGISSQARVLAVLPDLIDALSQHASPSTVRQRQWAINQAVEHYAWTTTGRADLNTLTRVTLADLLDTTSVAAYLHAAETGQLRVRSPSGERPRPESNRTTAARAAALRWLAGHTTLQAPPVVSQDTTLIDPSRDLADHLRRAVSVWTETQRPALLRAAAAAACVTSAAVTSTRLAGLTITDLDNTPARITIPTEPLDPLPHNFQLTDPHHARARIHPWAVPALRAWLLYRAELINNLDGAEPAALFVTCHPSNQNVPPGMPVSVRGLTAGYRAAIGRLDTMAPQLHPPATLATVRRVALANMLGPA